MSTHILKKLCMVSLLAFSLIAGALPMGMGVPAAYAAGENIVPNPSLEMAEPLNSSMPAHWGKGRWGTNTAVFTYPVPGYGGGRAARVDLVSRTSGDVKWYFAPISIKPGTTYTFSDYAKSDVSQYITAEYELVGGTKVYKDLATPGPSSGWQKNSFSFTTPANAVKLSMFHLINKVGSLTIDEMDIREAGGVPSPSPTPSPLYTPPAIPTPSPSPSVSPSPTPSPVVTPTPPAAGGMISFTFDDNWKSARDAAIPMLDKKGYKATLYLISSALDGNYSNYMTASDALAMQRRGHEIGSHSRTHVDLSTVGSMRLWNEVMGSRTELANLGFGMVKSFAYPYGTYTSAVVQAVKSAGYQTARSTDDGMNAKLGLNPYVLRHEGLTLDTSVAQVKAWIDDAAKSKSWLILTIHRVDTSGDEYSTVPQDLQQIVDYVAAKNMQVVTVSQGMQILSR
jgi:peptidoglycan/xylan/chitin deacetylase (PgdA/CDA1 family)